MKRKRKARLIGYAVISPYCSKNFVSRTRLGNEYVPVYWDKEGAKACDGTEERKIVRVTVEEIKERSNDK